MRLTFLSSIVSGRTEQEIRDRKQETGNRKKEFRKDIEKGYELRITFLFSIVSGRTEQEVSSRNQEIVAKGTGSTIQGTGIRNKKLGTEQKEEIWKAL